MKSKWLLLVLMLAAVLAACQSSQPTASPAPVQGAYPAPQQQQNNQSYPAPTQIPPSSVTPYPPAETPSSDTVWESAVQMIQSGSVATIAQDNLKVTLTLKDGRVFTTTSYTPDDAKNALKQCGDICKDTKINP